MSDWRSAGELRDVLRAFRAKHGLSGERAASIFDVSLRRWRDWESESGAKPAHVAMLMFALEGYEATRGDDG